MCTTGNGPEAHTCTSRVSTPHHPTQTLNPTNNFLLSNHMLRPLRSKDPPTPSQSHRLSHTLLRSVPPPTPSLSQSRAVQEEAHLYAEPNAPVRAHRLLLLLRRRREVFR